MNEIARNLKDNRAIQLATLLSLFMGAAVTRSMATLRNPTSQSPNGSCGHPCSLSSQCTSVCTICGTGTCHN